MRIGCSSSRSLGISCTSRNARPATVAAAASGCQVANRGRRVRAAARIAASTCGRGSSREAFRHSRSISDVEFVVLIGPPGASLQVLQRGSQPAVRIAQPALDRLDRRAAERRDLPQTEATLDVQQERVALRGRYGLERRDQALARLERASSTRAGRPRVVRPSARLRRRTRRLHRRARRIAPRDARASDRRACFARWCRATS